MARHFLTCSEQENTAVFLVWSFWWINIENTANTTFSSPQGNLPISKEVNRKKSEAEGARLAPASGYGQHFTKINYLYSF
uniref:Protein p311 n=1 Tax=Geospiza parvula TaxID=87175 RepID=A0A8C3N2S4_GEOPR